MLQDLLEGYRIILASGSPRRQEFFKQLQLECTIDVRSVEEVYPQHLRGAEISDYLAQLKATTFEGDLKENDILITSDTVVWHKEKSLAKPENAKEAFTMLQTLSNDWHEVITSVCFSRTSEQKIIHDITKVKFVALTDEEIQFYVETCTPFDKAGGYGIQDWIGSIGIEEIKGSYNTVMGLPTHIVYKTLISMVS